MTTEITRFDPFNEMRSMTRLMDRMMHGWPAVSREPVELSTFEATLPVDIYEQGDNLIVKAAIPGVNPKDIHVSITDNVLELSAETQAEQNVDDKDYHRREYRYGKWSRSFRLPENLNTENCKAKYDNGMLRLTIPRARGAKSRSIKVAVGG